MSTKIFLSFLHSLMWVYLITVIVVVTTLSFLMDWKSVMKEYNTQFSSPEPTPRVIPQQSYSPWENSPRNEIKDLKNRIRRLKNVLKTKRNWDEYCECQDGAHRMIDGYCEMCTGASGETFSGRELVEAEIEQYQLELSETYGIMFPKGRRR